MLSKFFLFTSLAHLFDASLRIIFINFLQNFHHVTLPLPLSFPNPEHNKMTNITPNAWQQISASNFTNFYSQPFNSSPGKKGGREKFERRVSITDIPSRGSRNDEMIKQTRSGHCIVTYVRHYHFALVNANVRPDSGECIVPALPSPSSLCCTDERFVRGPHVRTAL